MLVSMTDSVGLNADEGVGFFSGGWRIGNTVDDGSVGG